MATHIICVPELGQQPAALQVKPSPEAIAVNEAADKMLRAESQAWKLPLGHNAVAHSEAQLGPLILPSFFSTHTRVGVSWKQV
jgi:hypothetical protein